MMNLIQTSVVVAGFCSLLLVDVVQGHESAAAGDRWNGSRPDGHAPMGVMGDHMHQQGEVMFGYRYQTMEMRGGLDGDSAIRTGDVLVDYMSGPRSMSMEAHLAGVMYAPLDEVTLVLMLPYLRKEMEAVNRMGVRFGTVAEGVGDIRLSGLVRLFENAQAHLHLNCGVSFPTGAITERDDTPAGPNQKLPYPMQLGSGTFDLLPGLTYLGQAGDWSWGAQALGVVRLGRNDEGYSQGDGVFLTGWLARRWTDWASTSARLGGSWSGDVDGRDPELNPLMSPAANPGGRERTRLDLLFGINLYGRRSWWRAHRLAIEGGFPVYEHVNGPQLATDWLITVGWQWSH